MNLFKKFFIIVFILGAILIFGYILRTILIKNSSSQSPQFLGTESKQFINYYINRLDYQFKIVEEDFIITKNSREAKFNADSNVYAFLADWTTFDQRLYPNNDCKYVRISIPNGQTSLNGNILFACVDKIENDTFENLSTFK